MAAALSMGFTKTANYYNQDKTGYGNKQIDFDTPMILY